MSIRTEVIPFVLGTIALFGLFAILLRWLRKKKGAALSTAAGILAVAYLLYFFRDPERKPPRDPSAILSGADGRVVRIDRVQEEEHLHANAVRISIFLSLLNVHVNRAPMAGEVTFLGEFPGKRYFTFQHKASDHNTHNTVVIKGAETTCLVKQIAGPVTRDVVYWLEPGQFIGGGERIGMMKFGSRLDIYLPAADVEVRVQEGDCVRAGETAVAVLKKEATP
ncbi:MAG: phosphatidylserine decarboxylase family protein [Kiritimatiellae bacterium]|nr:phosphatidylserine decarboxylase family protein [Kiritimatiellia bacterium]